MTADALNKLGKYEIRGTLGKGAMGIVYEGFDPVIERRVAIKTIAKQSLDPSETAELLSRFKREAQAAGRLSHPGIVSIHDYGEDDGLAFIAMEFIKGNELRKYFESQQRFPLTQIVRIMCDILDALDHAHRNGVVHRDIKPGNIMITDEGRVKVADFGVAWIESSTMTQVGMRIGTPAYMSPEQHQGLPVTGRSDLFSVGVILYEFLTGERPFTGSGYTLIQQILLQHPTPPSQINFEIPRALDAVTMKALAKRPDDRFASAHEFADAFRKAATGESVVAFVDYVLDDGASPANSAGVMPPLASSRGTSGASANSVASNPSDVSLEAELEYWKEIKDSTEAADFEMFLQVFPLSRFAPLARRRMSRLQAEAKVAQDADDQAPRAAANWARVEEEAARSAAEEARRADQERHRLESEALARRQAEDQHRRGEEKTRLLAEVDAPPAADDCALEGKATCDEAKRSERPPQPAHRKRDADWRLLRSDAQEPKLKLRLGGGAEDLMPAIDLSPRVLDQAAPAAVAVSRVGAANGPVRAGRLAGKSAHAEAMPVSPHPRAFRASRKSRRLPIAAALAAVLVGSGIWYGNRQELVPVVATLEMEAQAILAHVMQQWAAMRGQAEDERTRAEAAPLAEQRKGEEALNAERNRQLALARQQEEAARTAALHNYRRAIALLDQGRNGEAVRLLRQLAYDGHGAAAKTLGDLYSTGEAVLLDRQEASHFYAIAERNGVRIDRAPPSAPR